MKLGRSIAKPDVVGVPFGSLPGNFGIHPLPASKRNSNVADDHTKNMKKKSKVKSVEMKEFDFDNANVFDFDHVKEQPKRRRKRKQ